ncbi:hypothetical protein [Anaerocolumna xylanovorans]|uniref:Uncharacterized protein n=1 Tax=Anaerocolumna xylanovorans DSM 12503 TaxID=1121345 RepID=A0A1M7YH97_9FIRM|nr:hypothetical protein [Anaerocolumna xylanovorans]SHO51973.1 hypothetical protein SAMN02745217_03431 [Anaerocolumna xylanovorans DSM 12503]
MNFDKEIKISLQIALSFVVFTSVFTLLGNLSSFVSMGVNKDSIVYFLKSNMLWFIVVILIILRLSIYLKKADGKYNPFFILNRTVRSTLGLLLAFEGLVLISSRAPALLLYIQANHQVASTFKEAYIRSMLASFVIPMIINLVKILLGLYFILQKNKNNEIE